jgi:hypothetical protein
MPYYHLRSLHSSCLLSDWHFSSIRHTDIMTASIQNNLHRDVNPTYETIQINANNVSPQQLLHLLAQRLPRDKFSVEMQQDDYTIRWDREYLGSGRQQEARSASHLISPRTS